MFKTIIYFLLVTSLSFFSPLTWAKEKSGGHEDKDILSGLDYPELQVVPRASDRLIMETNEEGKNWWRVHWPIQVSAISTLITGLTAGGNEDQNLSPDEEDDASLAATTATAIGASWLVGSILIGMYRPYKTELKRVVAIKGKGKRDQILRERLAEEALQKPAELLRTLKWFSVATNFGASVYAGVNRNSDGKVYAGVSALLAFLPLVFEHRYTEIYDKHREYKKKIYSPVSQWGVGFDRKTAEIYPRYTLTWNF